MEDYLHFMKTLPTQMNAKSELNKLKEDFERMSKEKGEICFQILEKQRKLLPWRVTRHTSSEFGAYSSRKNWLVYEACRKEELLPEDDRRYRF